MRRRYRTSVAVSLAAVLVALPAWGAGDAGKVLSVQRSAYVIRNQVTSPARPAMPLQVSDQVATERQSRAKLFFSDDSILNLGESSRVSVEEYLKSPEKERSRSIYRLVEGSLKVIVGQSDLEIHTPTSVAAARGTSFIIWNEGTGAALRSCLMVLDGSVALSGLAGVGGEDLLGPGRMNCVPSGGGPGTQGPIDPDKLKRFAAETLVLGEVEIERGGGGLPAFPPGGAKKPGDGLTIDQPPVPQVPVIIEEPPIEPPIEPPVIPGERKPPKEEQQP